MRWRRTFISPKMALSSYPTYVPNPSHPYFIVVTFPPPGRLIVIQDATLKRCFGRSEKIIDCLWSDLSRLRTLEEPHEAMPRLADLLEYLARPGLEDVWVLLDIKVDESPLHPSLDPSTPVSVYSHLLHRALMVIAVGAGR